MLSRLKCQPALRFSVGVIVVLLALAMIWRFSQRPDYKGNGRIRRDAKSSAKRRTAHAIEGCVPLDTASQARKREIDRLTNGYLARLADNDARRDAWR